MNSELTYGGFETQDKSYDCGAHAIRHSLLVLGIPCVHEQIVKTAETIGMWRSYIRYGTIKNAGTSEKKICNALKRCGFAPKVCDTYDLAAARTFLDRSLDSGCPIILSVDDEDHWVAAIGKVSGRYVIADSWDWHKYPTSTKAVSLYGWDDLWDNRWYHNCPDCGESIHKWLRQGENWCPDCDGYCVDALGDDCSTCKGKGWIHCETCGGHGFGHYGISVVPMPGLPPIHGAVPRMEMLAKDLVRDQSLQEYWGYYLSDLIGCARNLGDGSARPGTPIARELEMARAELIDRAGHWIAGVAASAIRKELANYILVARCYDLKVPAGMSECFMRDFTMAFTMTLAEWYVFS